MAAFKFAGFTVFVRNDGSANFYDFLNLLDTFKGLVREYGGNNVKDEQLAAIDFVTKLAIDVENEGQITLDEVWNSYNFFYGPNTEKPSFEVLNSAFDIVDTWAMKVSSMYDPQAIIHLCQHLAHA
jgi:hypothetical protein